MKKTTVILILLILGFNLHAQKFISKSGYVRFYSYTPIEEIEGINNVAASILDASSGDIQVSMLNRSFAFKKELMQEHFNENYMESDTYPKSSFKGKVNNIGQVDFTKDGSYEVTVEGDITIHGVTKKQSIPGTIEIKNGVPTAKAVFKLIPKDYNIQIPDLVKEKIAKEIDVTIDITFQKH